MIMIEKADLQTIELIQGDTLFIYFTIPALNEMVVNRVVFTCKQLNLNVDCVPIIEGSDSGEESEIVTGPATWLLQKNETHDFRIGDFNYDLTVETSDAITTLIYNGRIKVIPFTPGKKHYKDYYNYPHNTTKEHD